MFLLSFFKKKIFFYVYTEIRIPKPNSILVLVSVCNSDAMSEDKDKTVIIIQFTIIAYMYYYPLVGPFLGRFYFYAQTLQTMSQGWNIRVFGLPVHEKMFFKIHQILHLFAPYWAPIGASPLTFANLNPHSPKILPTKFGSNWFSGFGEEVV